MVVGVPPDNLIGYVQKYYLLLDYIIFQSHLYVSPPCKHYMLKYNSIFCGGNIWAGFMVFYK